MAKVGLESDLLCLFKSHLPLLCLTALLCIALGTLVVMNNHEWERLQALSTLPTPFNAPLALSSGAPGTS